MVFPRKKGILITLGVLILIIGSALFMRKKNVTPRETVVVKKAPLIATVNVTGKVKSAQYVDLAFDRSGRVAQVFVEVGKEVAKGQSLVTLEHADLAAQVAQAHAGAESARAQLNALERGTRPEEIAIAEIKKTNADKSLLDAETNLANVKAKADVDLGNLYNDVRDVLQDAYTKADDAVQKQIDDLFVNDTTANPQLTFTSDSQARIDAESQRVTAGNVLTVFKAELSVLGTTAPLLDDALQRAARHCTTIRDFLVRLQDTLNSAVGLSATTLAAYKTSVNTGRTNMNTAIAAINAKQQAIAAEKVANKNAIAAAEAKVQDAKNARDTAVSELALKRAGSTPEQIAVQQAQLQSAEANAAYARAQLAKTILQSPFVGIVTKQDAKVGEIVTANTPVVSLIAKSKFSLEAFVPEADIAKIAIGQNADVTLDAYGKDVTFAATIVAMDPAETIIEGVATYKATLQFTEDDARVKSGMTANIDVVTAMRDAAIAIPQRAVIENDSKKTVQLLDNDGQVRVAPVTTGVRASDGSVEIISGLSEGDRVIVR